MACVHRSISGAIQLCPVEPPAERVGHGRGFELIVVRHALPEAEEPILRIEAFTATCAVAEVGTVGAAVGIRVDDQVTVLRA